MGMAVAMFMNWRGISPGQYDVLMQRLDLDGNPAAGAVLHLAALTDEGLEVCEVWRTEQALQGFLENRLLPAAHALALAGKPEMKVIPLHNMYAADPDTIDRIGMLSVPAAVASWAT
jgi:hypothetical protein